MPQPIKLINSYSAQACKQKFGEFPLIRFYESQHGTDTKTNRRQQLFPLGCNEKKMREMNQGYNSYKCGSTDNNENHKGTLLAVILTN